MNNIFYNIISIVIGIILIVFGIIELIRHNKSMGIISLIHGILFIGFGTYGFFVPKEYEFITVLSMLALAVTMIFALLLTKTIKKS